MNLGNQDWWMGPLCLGLAVTVGCGSEYIAVSTEGASTASFTETNHPIAEFQSTVDSPVKNGLDDANLMTSATANQRIIYSCVIGLVVEDYHQFESQLPNLIRKFGGFVASSDTDRQYKDQQRGVWVVRIPVQNYAGFLSGIGGIGFAESRSENATDVTEEYIDLEARIGNKQRLEDRIVKMLEERTGKLSEVLDIERELARVREEIERMQGRLRFLKDRSSMATVTLHCREQKEYVPPEAPTFVSRIVNSWLGSIHALRLTSENFALALTTAMPWTVIVGLPIWSIWRLVKRRRRDRIAETT